MEESADLMAASGQRHVAEPATGFKKEIRLPWPRFTPITESRQTKLARERINHGVEAENTAFA